MIARKEVVLGLWLLSTSCLGFVPVGVQVVRPHACNSQGKRDVKLGMAKKMRNKQADLAKKMAMAKERASREQQDGDEPGSSEKSAKLTNAEMKEKNDRLRFEQLLKTQSSAVLNDYSSDGYLNKRQEEEEIKAARSGIERLFEGDPAPTEPFEELVSIKSENAISKKGASRLIPWLKSSNSNDYLVIISDPRMKSPEIRQTAKNLQSRLPPEIQKRLIYINADTPAENRRWLKKSELSDSINVYSDEKMDWMRAYTALGDKRWSMTMFIIAEERVQKIARELDGDAAAMVVQNAVKSLQAPRI